MSLHRLKNLNYFLIVSQCFEFLTLDLNYHFNLISGAMNVSIHTGYTKLENKICKNPLESFTNFANAMNECNEDGGCAAVQDALCDNGGPFKLCATSYQTLDSEHGSCIYEKTGIVLLKLVSQLHGNKKPLCQFSSIQLYSR